MAETFIVCVTYFDNTFAVDPHNSSVIEENPRISLAVGGPLGPVFYQHIMFAGRDVDGLFSRCCDSMAQDPDQRQG